jgi:hypothetical protein
VNEASPNAAVEIEALLKLFMIGPALVALEMRALIASLTERTRPCFKCGNVTITKRRRKTGQRTFCSRRCGNRQAFDDYVSRGSRPIARARLRTRKRSAKRVRA